MVIGYELGLFIFFLASSPKLTGANSIKASQVSRFVCFMAEFTALKDAFYFAARERFLNKVIGRELVFAHSYSFAVAEVVAFFPWIHFLSPIHY